MNRTAVVQQAPIGTTVTVIADGTLIGCNEFRGVAYDHREDLLILADVRRVGR